MYDGEVRLTGKSVLTVHSRTPFTDMARLLVAAGHDPGVVLEMRREGSDTIALRGRIGKAAGLTVQETDGAPRFVRWWPRPCVEGAPQAAADEPHGPGPPGRGRNASAGSIARAPYSPAARFG